MRRVGPKEENMTDAALMEGAAAKLRALWLDFETEAAKGQTGYAEDAFSEVLAYLEEAVSTLTSAATKATENAVTDAADDLADRLYEDRRDD